MRRLSVLKESFPQGKPQLQSTIMPWTRMRCCIMLPATSLQSLQCRHSPELCWVIQPRAVSADPAKSWVLEQSNTAWPRGNATGGDMHDVPTRKVSCLRKSFFTASVSARLKPEMRSLQMRAVRLAHSFKLSMNFGVHVYLSPPQMLEMNKLLCAGYPA